MKNTIKLLLVLFLVVGSSQLVSAQSNKRKLVVGIGTNGINYRSVHRDARGWISTKELTDRSTWFNTVRLFASYKLNKSIAADFDINLGNVNYNRYIFNGYQAKRITGSTSFTKIGLGARYKFTNDYVLKEDFFIDPYVRMGVNYLNYNYEPMYAGLSNKDQIQNTRLIKESNFFAISWGLGTNIWVAKGFGVNLEANYNYVGSVPNTSYADFVQYSIGIVYRPKFNKTIEDKVTEEPKEKKNNDTDGDGIKDSKDECPEIAGLEKFNGCADTDNDGVKDSEDNYPNQAGTIENKGCPVVEKIKDTDSDGIPDSDDRCVDQAGPKENNGCPYPDTDGDGVLDKDDNCINLKGIASNNGCPLVDTDNDGTPDKDDRCVNQAGPKDNFGCPLEKGEKGSLLTKIVFSSEAIKFKSASEKISSYNEKIINNLVEKMNTTHSNKNFYIDGYSDSQGNADYNKALSLKRAKTVIGLLAKKGVSANRLKPRGFGEINPIGDNNTVAGRAENRRVEISLMK